jgi:geranylgeranyl diphosphate synthase, type II
MPNVLVPSLTPFLEQIEQKLNKLFPPLTGNAQTLRESLRYSLLNGGKRLRALLCLTVAKMLGGDPTAALVPACSLELIHTYSLVHDDLPCMDDDDYRRGRLTCHKVYGEATALLTGDLLLTRAFELLAKAPYLTAEQRLSLITVLSSHIGDRGLILGQDLDLRTTDHIEETLSEIHLNKTGALIAASAEFGAISTGAHPDICTLLNHFGFELGLAFQIMDDVLDVTSEKRGGSRSSDLANHKTTYVTLLGVEEAKLKAEETLACALDRLGQFDGDKEELTLLAKRFVYRLK